MPDDAALTAEANEFRDDLARIRAEVGKIIVGQERVVEGTITAIICGGNVLLEGVPGLGKTELVKALGRALREAVTPTGGSAPLSTKGIIDD